MRKQIGIYDYIRVEEDQITVVYNDRDETEPTDRIIMIFIKRGDQVFSQANINDPGYLEIYANAIGIFNGTINIE